MKTLIPITLIASLLFASGCGLKEVIGPNANGNNNIGGTTNSDSYQPVVKGSTWTYNLQLLGLQVGNATITMTGDVQTFNNTIFYKQKTVNPGGDIAYGFSGRSGSLYLNHDVDTGIDEPYLDDSKPAGASYTVAINDPAYPGTPARYVGTIAEKGIIKTVNAKAFKNVVHTHVELQYDKGNGYETATTDEFYIAKGVGIVEWDTYLSGQSLLKQTIVSYNIK